MTRSQHTPTAGERLGILRFLEEAERLKDVLRSAHTSGGRTESTAEHTWRLCLWAMTLQPWLPGIDAHRLLKLCVLHDLGEALHGDTPATQQAFDPGKSERERADLRAITESLPAVVRDEFRTLWLEYESATTAEARLAKGRWTWGFPRINPHTGTDAAGSRRPTACLGQSARPSSSSRPRLG